MSINVSTVHCTKMVMIGTHSVACSRNFQMLVLGRTSHSIIVGRSQLESRLSRRDGTVEDDLLLAWTRSDCTVCARAETLLHSSYTRTQTVAAKTTRTSKAER